MDSPDLQFKYQKLAFEYSKLRAQNQVLKRAVKDEQEKALQLKEDINSRDQSLRKAEQELDSLSFRNQQLTKRLSLLQDDLEIVKSKAKKGIAKADSLTSNYFNDSNVYAEELESKIQENARLHAELKDLEAFYKNKIIVLENKLEEILRNATRRPENIYSKDQDVRTLTNSFEEKNISPIENHRETENFVNGSRLQLFSVFEDQKQIPPKVRMKSQINDEVNEYLCSKPSRVILMELIDPIKELSIGFSSFVSSYLLLLKEILRRATSAEMKVVDKLSQEVSTWQELGKRFEEMISGNVNWDATSVTSLKCLSSFYESIIKCSSLLKKLHVVSNRYFSLQNTQLENAWKKSLGSVASCFTSIIPYLATLTYFCNDGILIARFTRRKAVTHLQERISKLVGTSNELLTAWSLLVVEGQEETKNSLLRINKSLRKVNVFLLEKIVSSKDSSFDSFSLFSSALAQSPETPRLPYLINAVSSDNFLFGCLHENFNSSNNEISLAQKLSQATSRLAKLEEEREHWKLECQLLSHRFKKENRELNEDRTCELTNVHSEASEQSVKIQGSVINNSIIGELQDSFCSAEEREKQIRDHFTNRCSQLFLQLTSCISQAALYQNECENLLHCLSISEDSKALIEKEIEEQRREKTEIQEALSTTSRNYEEQISAMSEHIADMNEKITLQAETIEQLSFQLKKKKF